MSMSREPATCAILLGAGQGKRFVAPSHKLTAVLGDRPVYQWALHALATAGFAHVVVVTGAVWLDLPDWVIHAPNPNWADGQASSLQRGIAIATELEVRAVVVGLADQPFVTTEAWRSVAASPHPIAVATYAGRRSNPVRLHHSVWSLLPTEADHGARILMQSRPDLVGEVACQGSPADIDTMEDLQRWNSSMNSPSTDPSTKHGL